jgi:hypothetical protein
MISHETVCECVAVYYNARREDLAEGDVDNHCMLRALEYFERKLQEEIPVEKAYTASFLGNPFDGGVSMSIDHLKSRIVLLDEELFKIEALEVNQTAHFMGNLRIVRRQ